MEGLQRSAVSFRRQGSSGHVWDDKFLGELIIQAGNNNHKQEEQVQVPQDNITSVSNKEADQGEVIKPVKIERSRSNGGGQRGYRTGRVSPAVEPPSPKVSACGFCGAFGKQEKGRRKKAGKGRCR